MKQLTAGLLSLAITAAISTPALAAGPARALSLSGETNGEITTSAPVNYSDGTRSQLYSLQLAAGQAVQLTLEGALKGSLSVFYRDTLISRAESEDECCTKLSMRAEKAGQYLVAVNAADARAFGPYQLSAEPIAAYDGKPLTGNSRITDWLRNGDKSYTLQVAQPGLYTIDLESNEFDTRLQLSGNGLSLEDDDGGQHLNSRLLAPLKPGSYTVTAGGFSDASGAFYLNINRAEMPEGLVFEDGTPLPVDGDTSSFVGSEDTRSFVLTLPESRRVQFDASSNDIDTYLTLQGGDITLNDDDGAGNSTNSRITQVLDAGEYNVSVRSVNGRGGVFKLATTTTAAPDGPSRPELKIGREQQGVLRPGNHDLYTLEIPRKGNYVISMTGNGELDGMVTLMRNGEEVAQQDDSDSSLDPSLEVELEAGRYVLLAHSFDPNANGGYRLLVRRK